MTWRSSARRGVATLLGVVCVYATAVPVQAEEGEGGSAPEASAADAVNEAASSEVGDFDFDAAEQYEGDPGDSPEFDEADASSAGKTGREIEAPRGEAW